VTSTAASPSVPAVADHASEAAAPGSSAAAADKTKKGFVYTARATPAATEAKPEAPPPAVAPAAPGFFTVDTYPATRVSVDGRPLGETPLVRIFLAPGPHTVTFDDGAGLHKSSTIEIKSGEALSRRFSFE
jgi:serine/threonine-protein kinase